MKFRFLFTLAVLLAQPGFVFAQQRDAVASNGYVFSAAPFGTALAVTTGLDGKNKFFCSVQAGFDGKLFISRQGQENNPWLKETEMPAGYAFSTSFGCFGKDGVYMVSAHPTLRFGTNPALTLFVKTQEGLTPVLESNKTRFNFPDPVSGKTTGYTYLQAAGFEFSGSRAVATIAAAPDTPMGSPVPSAPQLLVVELGSSEVRLLFNTSVATNKYSVSPVAFCISNSSLYLLGQVPDNLPASKTAQALFRVTSGKLAMLKDYFEPAGKQIACTDNGVQAYAQTQSGLSFSYFADTSTAEQVFFAGNQVEGASLSSKDIQYPVSAQELYLVTAGKAAVYINGGKARLAKTPAQNPKGTPTGVLTAQKQTLLMQAEAGSRSFWMFAPAMGIAAYSGKPGTSLSLSGTDLVIEGQLPSVMLDGVPADYSADTQGTLTLRLPTDVQPGAVLNGTVSVWGMALGFTVQILPPEAPDAPKIVSAFAENETFAPRSILEIGHSRIRDDFEAADPASPVFSLGGISAFLDDTPLRFLASGPETLSVLLPKAAIGKASGKLTIHLSRDGYELDSAPVAITLAPQSDRLFGFDFAGIQLPLIFRENGTLITQFTPAKPGDVLTAFGTGCAIDPLPEDWENLAEDTAAAQLELLINEAKLSADSATMLTRKPGVCKYQFTLPLDTQAGTAQLTFASSGAKYPLFVQ